MSTSTSGNGNNHSQLREFVALTSHAFAVAFSSCYSFVYNATRWSFSPLVLAYPVISYLLAPLLVFAVMVINISLLAPFGVIRYLLSSLYPVYVFCGVACITGVAVGLGGRNLSARLTSLLTTSGHDGGVPAARGTERSRRRRLRIKEEDS